MASASGRRRLGSVLRRPVLWGVAVVGAAVTTLGVAVVTGAFSGWINPDRIADAVAPGSDIQVITNIKQLDDQGSSVAMARNFQPPTALWQEMQAQNGARESIDVLRSSGAADLEDLSVQVTLVNPRREQIRVLDMKVIDVQRTTPLSGTLFVAPPQEGQADLMMMTDFDQARPEVDSILPAEGPVYRPGQPYFDGHSISLGAGEQQVLMYRAHVTKYSVTFKLEIDYLIGGTEKSQVIDNAGKPFAVTGVHTNSADGYWSYQRIFDMGGDLQYCAMMDPTDLSPDTAASC